MSVLDDDGTPVTILSGALGAGKTTTLNHLLTNPGDREIAVLVNDMGSVNVDAELVEAQGEGITELSNGCICCDLRDDLEVAVSRLARTGGFDHLVVESSGISAPAPVARLFTTGPASAPYRLDTLATVVDASSFRDTLAADDIVTTEDIRRKRPGQAETESEVRPLSDLLVSQAEHANVLLVNKCDLAEASDIDETEGLLAALNPDAERYRTTHGQVDADAILDTGLFGPDSLSESEHRARAIGHAEGHVHDPQSAYGVTSFAFRSRRPLHPERFLTYLRSLPDSVIRSKGLAWVAGRDHLALRYTGTGAVRRVIGYEQWIAAMPEQRQESQRRLRPDLPWDQEVGDRRTELVFIGREMDEESLREDLAACELTDEKLDTDFDSFENPFPEEEGEELTI
ncbi:MAG: cobalamin biosynthesis protein CobW [Halobacteriales archaeon SW_9_67_25]|nr:MAG: cobalamin biosynthesis protein CobW [Halobacteriales archaeon SW_9_67_25]